MPDSAAVARNHDLHTGSSFAKGRDNPCSEASDENDPSLSDLFLKDADSSETIVATINEVSHIMRQVFGEPVREDNLDSSSPAVTIVEETEAADAQMKIKGVLAAYSKTLMLQWHHVIDYKHLAFSRLTDHFAKMSRESKTNAIFGHRSPLTLVQDSGLLHLRRVG